MCIRDRCKKFKAGSFGKNHSQHRVCLFQSAFLSALHWVCLLYTSTDELSEAGIRYEEMKAEYEAIEEEVEEIDFSIEKAKSQRLSIKKEKTAISTPIHW